MTEIISHPSHADLEKLFVNNADLDKLGAYLGRFNPIRIMRIEHKEIRHSNILGWLLDPLENHGLGDRFLRAFLAEALKGKSMEKHPTALDIIQADLRDVEMRREWQNIDIFLLSRRNNWAFIIENKFHSTQHKGQLKKYMEKVRAAFKHEEDRLGIRGIFLTLNDEEPEDVSYASIGYKAICEILPRIMEAAGQTLGQQVRIFIEHYIEIIKEATDMSKERNEMEQLARTLYWEHRKALDFIWEHGPFTNFLPARDKVFESAWDDKIIFRDRNGNGFFSIESGDTWFSFLPLSWYQSLEKDEYSWPGCEDWWVGFPLNCYIELFPNEKGSGGLLTLVAEIAPLQNDEFRDELIHALKDIENQKGFQKICFDKKINFKKEYNFLKNNNIIINNVHDIDELSESILKLLNDFKNCFDAIGSVLGEFIKYANKKDA